MEKLNGNVGRRPHQRCTNHGADQLTVQMLLNAIPPQLGGAGWTLDLKPIDGSCPDVLHEAIFKFQRVSVVSIIADGIVEPAGKTLQFLNWFADQQFPATDSNGSTDNYMNGLIKADIDRWKDDAEKLRLKKDESKESKARWSNWKLRLRAMPDDIYKRN